MDLKLSKSDLILDWKIRVISGATFMLTTMLMYLLIQLSDQEGFRFGLYVTLSCGLSAAIVGGYFGPRIFRTISEEKFLGKLLALAFIILICEAVLIAFVFAMHTLIFGTSAQYASSAFVGMFIVLLVFYGIWRIIQIIITVSILFLGFRYIRDRELRE